MKKLIVDMDDVLCGKGFIRMINEFLETNYQEEDANSYYINDLIPKEKFSEWLQFFAEKNVYDYVDLEDDVQEVMEKLNKKYDIYIATSYVFRDDKQLSGKSLKDKFEYLYKNFPFINPEKYIFITNKEMIKADIRIDDSIQKLEGDAEIKLLFTAYHNVNISEEELKEKNLIRVNDWKEIELIFNSKDREEVNIGFRLGGNLGEAKGKAWFSEFSLEEGIPESNSNWKFACFIFNNTSVNINNNQVSLEVTQNDVRDIEDTISRFENSCYTLSEGKMRAKCDIYEINTPLSKLSYDEEFGYYVAPEDVEEQIKTTIEENNYDHIFVVVRLRRRRT